MTRAGRAITRRKESGQSRVDITLSVERLRQRNSTINRSRKMVDSALKFDEWNGTPALIQKSRDALWNIHGAKQGTCAQDSGDGIKQALLRGRREGIQLCRQGGKFHAIASALQSPQVILRTRQWSELGTRRGKAEIGSNVTMVERRQGGPHAQGPFRRQGRNNVRRKLAQAPFEQRLVKGSPVELAVNHRNNKDVKVRHNLIHMPSAKSELSCRPEHKAQHPDHLLTKAG